MFGLGRIAANAASVAESVRNTGRKAYPPAWQAALKAAQKGMGSAGYVTGSAGALPIVPPAPAPPEEQEPQWEALVRKALETQGRPDDPYVEEKRPSLDPFVPLPVRPKALPAPTRDLRGEAKDALTGGGIAAILGALTGKRGAGAAALTGFVAGNREGNEQAAEIARQRWQDYSDLQDRNFQSEYDAAQDQRALNLDKRQQTLDDWEARTRARRQEWTDRQDRRKSETDTALKAAEIARMARQEERNAALERSRLDFDIRTAGWKQMDAMRARLDVLRAEKQAAIREMNGAVRSLSQPGVNAATKRWLQSIIREAKERIKGVSDQGSQLTREINRINDTAKPIR